MCAGLNLESLQKSPQVEFQDLYKSCMGKRLRSIILTILKPTVTKKKTHLPSYLSNKLQWHDLDFSGREFLPFILYFLMVETVIKYLPPIL